MWPLGVVIDSPTFSQSLYLLQGAERFAVAVLPARPRRVAADNPALGSTLLCLSTRRSCDHPLIERNRVTVAEVVFRMPSGF